MNHPTLRRLRPFACALALVVALAQPAFVSTPAHAATVPTVTDGRLKILREAWSRYGPVIITLVWEVLTDWMTGDPPPPPQPIESPPQDPDFDP